MSRFFCQLPSCNALLAKKTTEKSQKIEIEIPSLGEVVRTRNIYILWNGYGLLACLKPLPILGECLFSQWSASVGQDELSNRFTLRGTNVKPPLLALSFTVWLVFVIFHANHVKAERLRCWPK